MREGLLKILRSLLRTRLSTVAVMLLALAAFCFLLLRTISSYTHVSLLWLSLPGFVGAVLLVVYVYLTPTYLALVLIVLRMRSSFFARRCEAIKLNVTADVSVTFDPHGVPTITAESEADALKTLGYLTARDRLFQMDLTRREAAGRLSELFGESTLALDMSRRTVGLQVAAREIFQHLPEDQKNILRSYTAGVNEFIDQIRTPSFEFFVLRYRPDPWTPEDSLLVILQLFQVLCGDESVERTLAIMRSSLPPAVVDFLTPNSDSYSSIIFGADTGVPADSIPVNDLASILNGSDQSTRRVVRPTELIGASNCWAVAGSKTSDGRAILANDMHLTFKVPNHWYRVRLRVADSDLSGVMTPGVPIILAGSNSHVSWGLTNLCGNCLNLVPLEINPDNELEYKADHRWTSFAVRHEQIKIRQRAVVDHEVKHTIWGPVCERPLLGGPVVLRWTALDPEAVDLGLVRLRDAKSVADAVDVVRAAGGPPLNVILADAQGHIAYAVCGRIPATEQNSATPVATYISAQDLPHVIDPACGYLANANDRAMGQTYPYALGRNYANGYRAHRINEQLSARSLIEERDMFELQLDKTTEFYEFYRALALEVAPDSSEARHIVAAWNGKAGAEDRGFLLLAHFREALAEAVLAPLLQPCVAADSQFIYCWQNYESPLRALLSQRPAALNPRRSDWNSLLREALQQSVEKMNLESRHARHAAIIHPLSLIFRQLAPLLNLSPEQSTGSLFSICVSAANYGATVRFVVSPGKESDGLFNMPGGQSENPLSNQYADHHAIWRSENLMGFLPGAPVTEIVLPGQTSTTRENA